MSRVKLKKQVFGSDRLLYTTEDLRFGTPEIVAEYRAQRLRCKVIADLGCSVGFQTFAFAKYCTKVYAVEVDKRKLDYTQKNAAILGLKNIVFLHGDALDKEVVQRVSDCEIVFADLERPAAEEHRTIASLHPNPLELIKLYSRITDKICLEVPPQWREIPFDGEKEYVSVEGKLNRLNVYLGRLQRAERSVVLLPTGERLEDHGANIKKVKEVTARYRYIYEINPAVVLAGLVGEVGDFELLEQEGKHYFLSERLTPSVWVTPYKIVAVVDQNEVSSALHNLRAGQVVLRGRMDPQQYWKERKKYEQGLSGKKKVHLFLLHLNLQPKAVIAEEVG